MKTIQEAMVCLCKVRLLRDEFVLRTSAVVQGSEEQRHKVEGHVGWSRPSLLIYGQFFFRARGKQENDAERYKHVYFSPF